MVAPAPAAVKPRLVFSARARRRLLPGGFFCHDGAAVRRPLRSRPCVGLLVFFGWLSVLGLAQPVAAQEDLATRRARQAWLKSTHRKIKKDSDRLLELTRDLEKEAARHEPNPLEPATRERLRALEPKAEKLREAVAAVDENFLSVPVVTQAEDLRDEARALQRSFAASPSASQLKKLQELARQIEKHANSIADRMSLP